MSTWAPSRFCSILNEVCEGSDLKLPSDLVIASFHACLCLADFELINKNDSSSSRSWSSTTPTVALPKSWNASTEYLSLTYKYSSQTYQIKYLTLGNHIIIHAMATDDKEKVSSIDLETYKIVSFDVLLPTLSPPSSLLVKDEDKIMQFLQKSQEFISCFLGNSNCSSYLAPPPASNNKEFVKPNQSEYASSEITPPMAIPLLRTNSSDFRPSLNALNSSSTSNPNLINSTTRLKESNFIPIIIDDNNEEEGEEVLMMIPGHPLFHRERKTPPPSPKKPYV